MTIGDRIKHRRKELGLSIEDIAEQLNKNRATVYRYESNDIENLPISILEPLSKILDCSPAYLMGWYDYEINDTSKIIAGKIKQCCLEKNISESHLLKDCQLSVSYLTEMSTNRKTPSIKSIMRIADYLGVSIDYLLCRTTNRNIVDADTNVESPKITPISQADGIQHLKAHAPENDEITDLIKKYRSLDETSKAAVNNYIDFELTQTQKRKGNI